MNININRVLYIILFLVFTALFTMTMSCSRTKPEIAFGFIKLVLYQGQGDEEPTQQFSFFIIPEDDEGLENLSELFLFHDREQLRWQIKSDEWINYTHEGREWIGTRSIAVNEGSLPRGVFRAVLVNKGGESSERSFTYDGEVRFPFPEIEITDGYFMINSQWSVNRLVCYDRAGNYVRTVTLTSLSGSVSELRLPSSVRTVALWAEDEENFCSAFTNAVSVN